MSEIAELFRIVAERMRGDLKLARAALTHPGLRGASFEEAFRSFLRSYLPRTVDVSTGVVVDAAGRYSRQLDVIVSDSARTPVLYAVGDTRVVPVECVYMAIEVKAHLDSASLTGCLENMRSVRTLEKRAYTHFGGSPQMTFNMYGQQWDYMPLMYFVFAFDSIGLATITKQLVDADFADQRGYDKRIDSICVLDKGVICNRTPDGKFDALPVPGCERFICATTDALLLFYTLLSRYFNQARMPEFRFTDYLGDMKFGTDGDDLVAAT